MRLKYVNSQYHKLDHSEQSMKQNNTNTLTDPFGHNLSFFYI